jgi:hypothetical protein
MNELDESKRSHAPGLSFCRLVHFHYVKNTEQYKKLQAGTPWEGETNDLKTLLIEATEIRGRLKGEGVPCPVVFEPEDNSLLLLDWFFRYLPTRCTHLLLLR